MSVTKATEILAKGNLSRALVECGDLRGYYAMPNGAEVLESTYNDRIAMCLIPTQSGGRIKEPSTEAFDRFVANIQVPAQGNKEDLIYFTAVRDEFS